MILPSQFFVRKILSLGWEGSGVWCGCVFAYSIFLGFHKKNPTLCVVFNLIIIAQG